MLIIANAQEVPLKPSRKSIDYLKFPSVCNQSTLLWIHINFIQLDNNKDVLNSFKLILSPFKSEEMQTKLFISLKHEHKKHGGGSIRATILPTAIVLTKACRTAVIKMAKGCILYI